MTGAGGRILWGSFALGCMLALYVVSPRISQQQTEVAIIPALASGKQQAKYSPHTLRNKDDEKAVLPPPAALPSPSRAPTKAGAATPALEPLEVLTDAQGCARRKQGTRKHSYPVGVFWHIATLAEGGHWRTIVRDQYKSLLSSGLVHTADEIQAVMVGDYNEGVRVLDDKCGYMKAVDGGSDTKKYEFATLVFLEKYCEDNPTGRVGYFHNKGARYSLSDWAFYAAWCWRKLLEHFVITLHEECLAVLEDDFPGGYHASGPNLFIGAYYSGNFWWAKCSHVNTLPRLRTLDWTNRWIPEWWLNKAAEQPGGPAFRPYNCWSPWPEATDMYTYEFPYTTALGNVTKCADPGFRPPYPVARYENAKEALHVVDLNQYKPEYLPKEIWEGDGR